MGTKTKDFYLSSISSCHFSFIALTETWLNKSINDAELFDLTKYNVFRRDRQHQLCNYARGGGVLLAVNTNVPANICDNEMCDRICDILPLVDILFVKCTINYCTIYFLIIYIPPTCNSNDYVVLFDFLLSLSFLYESQLIVIGDFNCPEYVQNVDSTIAPTISNQCINNFISFYNLQQHNRILNSNNRLLDLVFTNNETQCEVLRSQDPFLKEDTHHPALEIQIKMTKGHYKKFPTSLKNEYNFRKCNFPLLYESLQMVDWSFLENYSNVDDALEHFYSVLNNTFTVSVPNKKTTSVNYPVWFNSEVIKSIKLKNAAFKRYKKK